MARRFDKTDATTAHVRAWALLTEQRAGGALPLTGGTMSGSLLMGGNGAKFDASGDLWAVRAGGDTGVIYLNAAGTRYLYYSTVYNLPGAGLAVGGDITSAGLPLGRKIAVPATATSVGALGDFAADATHFYVCTATNVWRRVGIAAW